MLQKVRELWSKPNIKHILAITLLLFLSRGLGFVRSILIYKYMDRLSADLLLASTKIPETISSLLIMGTIMSSMLPIASRLENDKHGDEKASKYINIMMISIIFVLLIVTFFCFVFTPFLLRVSSPNLSETLIAKGLFVDYILTTRILLIGPFLFGLQAIFGVFLNIKKRFGVYSWAGSIYNLGTILGILVGVRNGYIQTSVGMMLGAFVTVILFWNEARKYGYRSYISEIWKAKSYISRIVNTNLREFKSDLVATWQVFLPRIFLINGAILANLLINNVAQNAGQITAFDIGLSIQGLFFSLVTSAGTVFFPDLAKAFNTQIKDTFWKKLNLYGKYIVLLAIVASVLTILLAPAVMWVFELFGKGQDNAQYIILIARVCTLSLVFQSLNEILSKYFYVRERVWQPVIISTLGLIGQFVAVFGLIALRSDAGVAVATGLGVANFIVCGVSIYLIFMDRRLETLHDIKNEV
jgi:peptidoglycan biosynthesis protein MviN/MurJ (putative lipid II flippase)